MSTSGDPTPLGTTLLTVNAVFFLLSLVTLLCYYNAQTRSLSHPTLQKMSVRILALAPLYTLSTLLRAHLPASHSYVWGKLLSLFLAAAYDGYVLFSFAEMLFILTGGNPLRLPASLTLRADPPFPCVLPLRFGLELTFVSPEGLYKFVSLSLKQLMVVRPAFLLVSELPAVAGDRGMVRTFRILGLLSLAYGMFVIFSFFRLVLPRVRKLKGGKVQFSPLAVFLLIKALILVLTIEEFALETCLSNWEEEEEESDGAGLLPGSSTSLGRSREEVRLVQVLSLVIGAECFVWVAFVAIKVFKVEAFEAVAFAGGEASGNGDVKEGVEMVDRDGSRTAVAGGGSEPEGTATAKTATTTVTTMTAMTMTMETGNGAVFNMGAGASFGKECLKFWVVSDARESEGDGVGLLGENTDI